MSGIDPGEWNGFAFGLGLTRLVMMRYGIDDIRLLQGGDLAIPGAVLNLEILVQLDSRTGRRPGYCRRASSKRLITMKTAECEGIEEVGALLAERVRGAGGIGRADCGQPQREGRGGDRRAMARRPWCAARRTAAPGCSRSMCRSARKRSRASRATACWRARAELGINRDHAGIIELGALRRLLRARSASSRSTTNRITHRPDLWGHHGMAREVAAILGKQLRDPVKLDLLPQGAAPITDRDRRSRSVPAIQRAGFRERHGAAVAVVAAIPAGSDRAEPDQQHRRYDELRHGGAGAADARVRCATSCTGDTIFVRPAQARASDSSR